MALPLIVDSSKKLIQERRLSHKLRKLYIFFLFTLFFSVTVKLICNSLLFDFNPQKEIVGYLSLHWQKDIPGVTERETVFSGRKAL